MVFQVGDTTRLRHGHAFRGSYSKEYNSWRGMMGRCYTPTHKEFKRYGGRGISVCERWHDFANFFDDMGIRPPKHSIDRIDNSGDYHPENCRWATLSEQGRNKRNNRLVTIGGETKILTDWAAIVGIAYATMLARIKKWPESRWLEPKFPNGRK